jgi:hypothetical protein
VGRRHGQGADAIAERNVGGRGRREPDGEWDKGVRCPARSDPSEHRHGDGRLRIRGGRPLLRRTAFGVRSRNLQPGAPEARRSPYQHPHGRFRQRDAELRAHNWNFAIERASLAADATAPAWGRARSFTLPSNYIKLLDPYPEDNANDRDWQIEGGKILTDDSAPLYIRYVKRVTDANAMDPLFREALAAKLAVELCEQITQSNTKKTDAREAYLQTIRQAKKANAIESVPAQPAEDSWITVRA